MQLIRDVLFKVFSNRHEITSLKGKVVSAAVIGVDSNGYDTIRLLFTDGTMFFAREDGQAGQIAFNVQHNNDAGE